MDINLSDIIKNGADRIDFEGVVELEPISYMGMRISFESVACVKGCVRAGADSVAVLEADVSGELCTECARCLKPVKKSFSAKLSETLVREDSEQKPEEAVVYEGFTLPLDELVADCIITNIEVKYVCSEECKGLCPKCGKDLNEGDCGCSTDFIDPRLEVLSRFCDK